MGVACSRSAFIRFTLFFYSFFLSTVFIQPQVPQQLLSTHSLQGLCYTGEMESPCKRAGSDGFGDAAHSGCGAFPPHVRSSPRPCTTLQPDPVLVLRLLPASRLAPAQPLEGEYSSAKPLAQAARSLYLVRVAAVTNHHKLGGLTAHIYSLSGL